MVNFNDIITNTNDIANHAMSVVIKNTSLKRYLQVTVGYIPVGMKCNRKTPEGFEILERHDKYNTSLENYILVVLRNKNWINTNELKKSDPKKYAKYHYNEDIENQILARECISPDYTVICRLFNCSRPSEYVITFQFTGEPITIPQAYYQKPSKKQYNFYGDEIEPIDIETARQKSNEYWQVYIQQKDYTKDFNIEFNEVVHLLMQIYYDDNKKYKEEYNKKEIELRKKYNLDSPEYLKIMEKENELREFLIKHIPRGIIQSVLRSYQLKHPCADLCRLFRKTYDLTGYHD